MEGEGQRLGLTAAALEPAESAGLIEPDGRVRFRDPLVRSAIYGSAGPEDRRAAHRALADATDAQVDPDRRAWHLAEAATTCKVCSKLDITSPTNSARCDPNALVSASWRSRAVSP
ncbi:MAG TPA: hypothetical protein VMA77_10805 [Solirubrobacteraceae bacterium]|nr:hypothetical protein [Solirubrobacteraceae bacterium]